MPRRPGAGDAASSLLSVIGKLGERDKYIIEEVGSHYGTSSVSHVFLLATSRCSQPATHS